MHQTFGNETALHIFKSLARSLHDVFDMPVFVKLNSCRQKAARGGTFSMGGEW